MCVVASIVSSVVSGSVLNVSVITVFYDVCKVADAENHCPFTTDLSTDYLAWSDLIIYKAVSMKRELL
jgi:hypothetical protein